MCPDKFLYEDLQHRIAKMGELYNSIYLIKCVSP
jgi:hypothetical protein